MHTTHDPVNSPSHYRGKTGMQSIDVTLAYRLGGLLMQAFDYIVRAGRKTGDPRQDLAKAVFYLRKAATHRVDLRFGFPIDERRPTPAQVSDEFGLCERRARAVGAILAPWPHATHCTEAADQLEMLLAELDEQAAVAKAAAATPMYARRHVVIGYASLPVPPAPAAQRDPQDDPEVTLLRMQRSHGEISSLTYAREMTRLGYGHVAADERRPTISDAIAAEEVV